MRNEVVFCISLELQHTIREEAACNYKILHTVGVRAGVWVWVAAPFHILAFSFRFSFISSGCLLVRGYRCLVWGSSTW